MNGSRARILAALRAAALARAATAPGAEAIPARARGDPGTLVERFVAMARFAGATVARVAAPAAVPAAVAAFLAHHRLGREITLVGEPWLEALPWAEQPGLVVHRRAPGAGDRVSVTGAVAGIAETGTLLVRSGARVANAAHLLPEAHVAVLAADAVVGAYEEGWARLAAAGDLPRAATFITGPSRTADIEKTPQIGVHGPQALHIVLLDSGHGGAEA